MIAAAKFWCRQPTTRFTLLRTSVTFRSTQLPPGRRLSAFMPSKRFSSPTLASEEEPRAPKRVRMPPVRTTVELSAEEERFCDLLDECAKELRKRRAGQEGLELRIAGGWVRDKLLGLPSNDLDVAVSSMTGKTFAEAFVDFVSSLPPFRTSDLRMSKLATIAARPDQSKHLETATTKLLGLELDFVQLRSEEYGEGSRIPEKVEFGTPLEDALRRDITINSLFYNVHSRAVEDFTEKGLEDLKAGIVRTPLPAEQTFQDDPLRLLRCVRFASRFGFSFDASIALAARSDPIRIALQEKISRERVGTEVEKMLKGPDPVRAIQLVHDLELYPLIFTPPASVTLPDSASQGALRAALMLSHLLEPKAPTPLPPLLPLRPELAGAAATSSTVRKRLFLAAALIPYRGLLAQAGKKKVWAGEVVIGESLKLGNHDRDYVSHLFSAADLIPNRPRYPSERVELGLLLRNPHVHDMKAADPSEALTWQASMLFSLMKELFRLETEAEREETVQRYNALVERIVALDLPACLTLSFEKARLDGKEICAALSIKPSKALAGVIAKVVERQLEHPSESKADAAGWLKGEVAAGRITTS